MGVTIDMKVKSYIQGPRWSGIKEFVFEGATAYGLTYKTLEEDKGLLKTTIYYEVEGDEASIMLFMEELQRSIKNHNSD
jgi:hypothetical protein